MKRAFKAACGILQRRLMAARPAAGPLAESQVIGFPQTPAPELVMVAAFGRAALQIRGRGLRSVR